MDRVLARALAESSLENGTLRVEGLMKNEIKQLNEELRNALLNCEIPHYKVVGVNVVTGGNTSSIDYITKLEGVSKSYTELFVTFDDLIYSGKYSKEENNNKLSDEINIPGTWYSLMAISNKVTSSNDTIFHTGMGMSSVANALLKNVDIIDFNRSGCAIHLIVKHGTGILDFEESSNFLKNSDYKPVRAVYDLNGIFSIKLYEESDKGIYLKYKRDINESVLLQILQEFGRSYIE